MINNFIVQTLRNTILVSIFVGGSAFQYGFLFLNTPAPIFKDQVRALILSILLFSSFLCWANTIRYANHLAFCVGALEFQIKEVENRLKLEKERLDLQRSDDLEGGTDFETAIEDKFDGQRVVESSSTINPPSTQPHECQGKKKQSRIRRRRNVDEILHELKLMSVSMLSSFSLGFRLLFVSIPFAFYSAGPIALIIASSVILIFLYNIDHVEKSTYSFMGGLSDLRKNA